MSKFKNYSLLRIVVDFIIKRLFFKQGNYENIVEALERFVNDDKEEVINLE